MCKEKQKLKTTFQFHTQSMGEQTGEFEYQTLDPVNLRQEVEAAHLSEQLFQDVRRQMPGKVPPAQVQRVRQAEPQLRAPQPAQQEMSWKERRTQRKKKEKNLKRGKKLTQYADEFTVELVDKQQAMNEDIHRFQDFGYARDDISEELTDILRSMQNVTVTADLFTNESYVSNYEFLRETLEKGTYIARIATSASLMEQLRARDFNLYSTALRWQQTEPMLRNMLRLANLTHGLKENGEPLQVDEVAVAHTTEGEGGETDLVRYTRERFGTALHNFRDAMARQEQAHWKVISGELQGEFEQELVRQKTEGIMNSTEEERQWLQSPSLTYDTGDAYETIQETKRLIESSGEVYLGNKDIVDKMYSDMIRRFEVLGELKAQSNAWGEIKYRYQAYQNQRQSDGCKLWREANRQLDRVMNDSIGVADNLTSIKNALTRLLKGERVNMLEAAVLESYGYHATVGIAKEMAQLVSARAKREVWQNETLQRLIQSGQFKPANESSEYVIRAVTLFRENDDAYNLRILNTLQKYEQEKTRNRPEKTSEMSDVRFRELVEEDARQRWPYYDALCEMLTPQVEQILNWDMERFMKMDDLQLMQAQGELDALFGANMFAVDLMKFPHPQMESWQMKEAFLGDRLEEFEHRVMVLRALTDKSRGLGLEMLVNLDYPIEECLTQQELDVKLPQVMTGIKPAEGHQIFAKKQIDLGQRLLRGEETKWKMNRDVNSEQFRTLCMNKFRKKGNRAKLPDVRTHLDEASRQYSRHFGEIKPDATQEEIDVVNRLKKEEYRIACWDKEDAIRYAREQGRNPDTMRDKDFITTMGEPIFRVFTTYAQTPGASTQSPEEFRQMVRDMSAGAQLKRGEATDEEIFEARELNMRGCRQFKETLRLTYDYLGRKYGYGLENLSALEINDHWEEILRDFGNIQVEDNFVNRIPGIMDMENEEDRVLYHRVGYLAKLSEAVQGMMALIAGGMTAEEAIQRIRSAALGADRDALKAMGEGAGMASSVTWGDTVKVGQRRVPEPEDPQARQERLEQFLSRENARREEQRRREEKLARERDDVEILEELEDVIVERKRDEWREKGVLYPNRHTEWLYRVRHEEMMRYNARINVSARLIKETGQPIPSNEKRVFWAFLPATQLDESGSMSQEDTQMVERMTRDYFFGTQQEHDAVVCHMVQGLCEQAFTEEMFSPEYIRENFAQMKALDRKMLLGRHLENNHLELFEGMPEEVKTLWHTVIMLQNILSTCIDATMQMSGLTATEDVHLGAQPLSEDEYKELFQGIHDSVQEVLAQWQQARQAYLGTQST